MQGVAAREAEIGRIEAEIRAACDAGDRDAAVTVALRRLGPEILRFLVHAHADETAGGDAFSLFAEDLWRGLPSFRWESSFRTWAYAIAKRASARLRRERADGKFVPLSDLGPLSAIVDDVKSRTLEIVRSERRTKLDMLKDELSVEERMLLSLRIDRELSWQEIAEIVSDSEGGLTPELPARLRKRFQLLTERLKRRGRELGLVPPAARARP